MASRAGDELPETFGLGNGSGMGIVGGFDKRKQSQFRRHVPFLKFLHDMEEVFRSALRRSLEIVRTSGEIIHVVFDERIVQIGDGETRADSSPDIDFVDGKNFCQGIVVVCVVTDEIEVGCGMKGGELGVFAVFRKGNVAGENGCRGRKGEAAGQSQNEKLESGFIRHIFQVNDVTEMQRRRACKRSCFRGKRKSALLPIRRAGSLSKTTCQTPILSHRPGCPADRHSRRVVQTVRPSRYPPYC